MYAEEPIERRYRDLALVGGYIGFRECRIQSDWLLVHSIDEDALILVTAQTVIRPDLFDE